MALIQIVRQPTKMKKSLKFCSRENAAKYIAGKKKAGEVFDLLRICFKSQGSF